jgi:CRISPR-associated protein Csd2
MIAVTAIENRYEFVYLFDIVNGNPNGDPDSGNMPRQDLDTQKGLVTDVALKRKIRNYVELARGGEATYAIYMQEKAVLNRQHKKAYAALGLKDETEKPTKEESKDAKAKARDITRWMCDKFYDIRAFGAVMTTEINAGQVRGPVQLGFAQSIDPVIPQEITITRSSVTNERDVDKERTMGRKYIVPYGLFRCHGFVSANLAGDETKGTGFSQEDLCLLFEALVNMFEHDRSAARMEMNAQRLIVFKHESRMGNAPAQKLFDLVEVRRASDVTLPRRFADYVTTIDRQRLPQGVEIIEKL